VGDLLEHGEEFGRGLDRPMPELAPVIKAVFPSNLPDMVFCPPLKKHVYWNYIPSGIMKCPEYRSP
jgi:hypothetical protein